MPFVQAILLENIQLAVRDVLPASATTIHTIEKCFVDLNFQTNENVNSSFPEKKAYFTSSSYDVSEGTTGTFFVALNSPSTLGIEEVDLYFIGTNSTGATINSDISFGYNLNEPIRVSWSGGEQLKLFSFTASTDYLIEDLEKFYFKLDHFTNCLPGAPIETTINVVNTTDFPLVSIISTNGSYVQDPQGVYKLNFGINEGGTKEIQISLSYPSILGQEEVDVVFINETANSLDYQTSVPQPIHITWGIGEQIKIISVSALLDSQLFEDSLEKLTIQLQNPIYTAVVSEPTSIPSTGVGKFPFARIQIFNQVPIVEYARVFLTPFATQVGRSNSAASLRQPYASYANGYTAVENKKFIPYQSNASNTYHPTFNNTQTLSNFNASKLSLEIKNIGTTQVMFGGSIIDVGSSITINNLSNTYYIDLPANLVQMINSQNETIITTAKYELTLNMLYVGNVSSSTNLLGVSTTNYTNGEFKLKNLDNTDGSSTKKFRIGEIQLNTYSQSTYSGLTNTYQATTKFSGIGTGRNGVSCPLFGFTDSTVENAQVNGVYFVDYYSSTSYIGVSFLQNGGINPTCNSSQYTIPYKILP